jgi:phosphate uptake regulator
MRAELIDQILLVLVEEGVDSLGKNGASDVLKEAFTPLAQLNPDLREHVSNRLDDLQSLVVKNIRSQLQRLQERYV